MTLLTHSARAFGLVLLLGVALFSQEASPAEKPARTIELGSAIDKEDLAAFKAIPVLASQRYQPLDTFARAYVRQVTGKEKFLKNEPIAVFAEWLFRPEVVLDEAWIKLPEKDVAKVLGLESPTQDHTHTSFRFLAQNRGWFSRISELREKDEKARTKTEVAALQFGQSVIAFANLVGATLDADPRDPSEVLMQGRVPMIPPRTPPAKGVRYDWVSPREATVPFSFGDGTTFLPWKAEEFQPVQDALLAVAAAWRAREGGKFAEASEALANALKGLNAYPPMDPDLPRADPKNKLAFPGQELIDREVALNALNPFSFLRFLYFFTFFFFLLALPFKGGTRLVITWIGIVAMVASASLHAYGVIERTSISGRAMIGNLYESLLYASGVIAVLSVGTEILVRRAWVGLAGSLMAFGGMWASQVAPDFWRPEISTLSAVLINNDLIHIHVPTIMTSYAVLGLSAILGHVWLVMWWFGGGAGGKKGGGGSSFGGFFASSSRQATLQEIARYMFWSIPIGSILLFVGIILGGVWADQSWGRFWGWDSKETSSLILWVWFMILIHGKWAGWLRDVGSALGSLLGGILLMWTWFGTNLFLRGLHSYAGTGDTPDVPLWVWIYCGIEFGFLAVTTFLFVARKNAKPDAPKKSDGDQVTFIPAS